MIAASATLFGLAVVGGLGVYAYHAGKGKAGTTGTPDGGGLLHDAAAGVGATIEKDATGGEHVVKMGELGPVIEPALGQPGPTPGVASPIGAATSVGAAIVAATAPRATAPHKAVVSDGGPLPYTPTAYSAPHVVSTYTAPLSSAYAQTARVAANAFTVAGNLSGAVW